MGKLELEMKRDRFKVPTRYVTYYSQRPEQRVDIIAMVQMNIKEAGLTHKTLPDSLRVTIEWDDVPVEEVTQ